MVQEVVRYALDDATAVTFEIDPLPGFQPASAERIVGRVQDAIAPAVEAARVVLDKVKQTGPEEIEVKFGIKVSGKMDWVIAKAATDANFEVKLVWRTREALIQSPQAAPGGPEEEAAEEDELPDLDDQRPDSD